MSGITPIGPDPFEPDSGWKPPRFRWWDWQEWKHRTAMRGFDDGTCWALDEEGDETRGLDTFARYFRPPLLWFRQAYIDEFWEGASK